jgi:hypothetical protein
MEHEILDESKQNFDKKTGDPFRGLLGCAAQETQGCLKNQSTESIINESIKIHCLNSCTYRCTHIVGERHFHGRSRPERGKALH